MKQLQTRFLFLLCSFVIWSVGSAAIPDLCHCLGVCLFGSRTFFMCLLPDIWTILMCFLPIFGLFWCEMNPKSVGIRKILFGFSHQLAIKYSHAVFCLLDALVDFSEHTAVHWSFPMSWCCFADSAGSNDVQSVRGRHILFAQSEFLNLVGVFVREATSGRETWTLQRVSCSKIVFHHWFGSSLFCLQWIACLSYGSDPFQASLIWQATADLVPCIYFIDKSFFGVTNEIMHTESHTCVHFQLGSTAGRQRQRDIMALFCHNLILGAGEQRQYGSSSDPEGVGILAITLSERGTDPLYRWNSFHAWYLSCSCVKDMSFLWFCCVYLLHASMFWLCECYLLWGCIYTSYISRHEWFCWISLVGGSNLNLQSGSISWVYGVLLATSHPTNEYALQTLLALELLLVVEETISKDASTGTVTVLRRNDFTSFKHFYCDWSSKKQL